MEDYYKLDYEDLIGGGTVKTRFKYRKVPDQSFGLTEDEILLLDDKHLNRLVSLKKYRPYMEQHEINEHRIKNIKGQFKDELNEKRK